MKTNKNTILCISDLHCPYEHRDTVDFLYAVKKKYKPGQVVLLGDEIDHHAMSFHAADPDLMSAGDELKAAITKLKCLYELFPVAEVIDSNHGSMHYRKGKHYGIPRKYLRDYADILEAPDGWTWHLDYTIHQKGGPDIYFHHGIAKNIIKVVKERGVCVVQGHYHTEFNIQYVGTPAYLLWGLQIGCSIDPVSLAFAYNRTNLGRPIIGHGIIIDGQPRLLPMVLNKRGRWIGEVP